MDKSVSKERMEQIYRAVETPYKLGPVLKLPHHLTDSPSVFRYGDRYYMHYIRIDKEVDSSGYETFLASSEDLIHFREEGVLLRRGDTDRWDARQMAGYVAYPDIRFGGSGEVESVGGRFYLTYLGGRLDGYETDPLSMGMAEAPCPLGPFVPFDKPVLSPSDPDARPYETKTVYKSYAFRDPEHTLGHPYVCVYNAKPADDRERIYLAVSDDGVTWHRYGEEPILNEVDEIEGLRISGDAQIVRMDGLYVMFYFRSVNGRAYNNFACSYDLVHWTVWDGPPLIYPEEEWEDVHAHKSYVLKVEDTVYHYYCAVNSLGERFIALATSRPMGEQK